MIKHTKKVAGFGILSMFVPFLVGADGDDVALAAGPHDVSFWLLLAKLAAGVLGPGFTLLIGMMLHAGGAAAIAYGRALIARGKARKADNDPSNDAAGETDLLIGAAIEAAGTKLDPPEKPTLQLAPPPSENMPKTGT